MSHNGDDYDSDGRRRKGMGTGRGRDGKQQGGVGGGRGAGEEGIRMGRCAIGKA